MYFKFKTLIIYLLYNFNYFNKDVQSEIIDTLSYYKDIAIVSKYGKE